MHCIIRLLGTASVLCFITESQEGKKKKTAQVGLRKRKTDSSVRARAGLIISVGFHLFSFFFFISVILCSFCACYNLAPVLFISQLYSITLQMSWSASPSVSPRRGRANADTGRN